MSDTYSEVWYLVRITETDPDEVEPDWSRVPEERRDLVRDRWHASRQKITRTWRLWGPQIPRYRTMGYDLEVIGLAPEPDAP